MEDRAEQRELIRGIDRQGAQPLAHLAGIGSAPGGKPKDLAEDARKCEVGGGALDGIAAAVERADPLLPCLAEDLAAQTRLADAGRPLDHEQAAGLGVLPP